MTAKTGGDKTRAQKRVEMDERRRQVAALLRARLPRADIVRQLGMSAPTLCRDIMAIRKQWKEEYAADYDQMLADELAVLADDERRWRTEMVQLLRDRTIKERKTFPDGTVEEKEISVPPNIDMALSSYDRVMAIMRQRAKLLGIEAPQKIAPTNPAGTEPWEGVSEEELARRMLTLIKNASTS